MFARTPPDLEILGARITGGGSRQSCADALPRLRPRWTRKSAPESGADRTERRPKPPLCTRGVRLVSGYRCLQFCAQRRKKGVDVNVGELIALWRHICLAQARYDGGRELTKCIRVRPGQSPFAVACSPSPL